MKESLFNIKMDINDKQIIYNTFSSGILSLDEEYSRKMKELKSFKFKEDLHDDLRLELIKGGMIIPDEEDEVTKLNLIHNAHKFSDETIGFTIAPTLECNFACIYCYEEGCRYNTMNKDILDSTIKFINNGVKGKKSFAISWYGGEPTLAIDEMEYIYNGIKENIENGVEYGSAIVTNGYLLDKEMAKRFNDLNISSVQVTIDGGREDHNNRRFLRNRKPTYDRIIKNIKEVYDMLNISIRINVDNTNKESIYEIFNELGQEVIDKVHIYVAPVSSTEDQEDFDSSNCIGLKEFSKVDLEFNDELDKIGKSPFLPHVSISGCGASTLNSYIIDPLGDLYKCWNYIGRAHHSIGNIKTGVIYNDLIKDYILEDNLTEECRTCNILPLCYGSCPDHMRVNRSLKDRCPVHKYNIEKQLEGFVLSKI